MFMNIYRKFTAYYSVLFLLVVFIMFFLCIFGLIERDGYLSNININIDETLKYNNIIKTDIPENIILDIYMLQNYLYTNSNITNYIYNYKLSYNSKFFRNNDLYDVYIKTNVIIDSIYKFAGGEKGSPFGYFSSLNKISEDTKISNIKYILKIKLSFILYLLLFFILLFLFYFISFNKRVLVIFLFLIFLILPNIIHTIFYDIFDNTNYENRVISKKPVLDFKHLNEYIKDYNIYFNDNLPFKNELVKLKNFIDVKFFKNIISTPRKLLGYEKWLFFNFTFRKLRNKLEEKELLELKNMLVSFNTRLKKENIDFILLICPKKEFVYPEYFPKYYKLENHDNRTEQFVEYMKGSGVKIIYIKDQLLTYKNDYKLYYKYDHHWNKLGAYVAYSELMKLLSLPYDDIDNLIIISNSYKNYNKNFLYSQYNDIAKGLALSESKIFTDDYIFDISNYYTNTSGYYKTNYLNWANFDTYSFSNYYNKKLFIIRDSYFSLMVDYIAPLFSNISFLHYNRFFDSKFNKGNKPDIFIAEYLDLNSYTIEEFVRMLSQKDINDIY